MTISNMLGLARLIPYYLKVKDIVSFLIDVTRNRIDLVVKCFICLIILKNDLANRRTSYQEYDLNNK